MNTRILFCIAAAVCAGVVSAAGRTTEAATLTKLPIIDGVINEGEWSEATHLTDFFDQAVGGKAADQTDAWIGVTEAGVYVAIHAHDSQPDKISARTVQRDGQFQGEDYAGVILDPMNRRAVEGNSQFFVNPLGTQWSNIAGGRIAKREWKGDWEGAASRVADGYIVELMIPWKLLSYPAGKKSNILFNIARLNNRTQTASYWSNPGNPFMADNHGTILDVQFPKRDLSEQIDLLGYFSPEYDRDSRPQTSFRTGFDLRYRPTETTTSVLSVSPDFRNIEGQVEGIGFTRTERRLADTRPFFVEGSRYFNLTDDEVGQMFYSRRIDDFDQGIKYFGNLDRRNSIGILATHEDGKRLDSVFRYNNQLGSRSNISVYSTYRDEPGRKSSVIGSSGTFAFGNTGLYYDLIQSDDAGMAGMASSAAVSYQLPNFFGIARATMLQPTFRARLGFVPEVDLRGGYVYGEYARALRKGGIRSYGMDFFAEDNERFDGNNGERQASLGGFVTWRNDWQLRMSAYTNRYETEESKELNFNIGYGVSNPLKNAYLSYSFGERAGDFTSFLAATGTYRLAKGVDFGFRHSVLNFQGFSDQTILTLGWEMDAEQALSARWVETDGDSNWYLAYRKAGGKGLEYFLIIGDPNSATTRDRVALKVVWAR
ncbi:MAG: hypothetical protein KF824_10895 [Fimbriimonadaceae bacterium]|nr:MAG: hypothetical protein KF824_10895 [Fimbriimonadaceae bacterium]